MKIVVDSGGSKTDWAIQLGAEWHIETLANSSKDSEAGQSVPKQILDKAAEITELHYYGAGLYNEDKCDQQRGQLAQIFRESEIKCYSDLLGACRATAANEAGIVCILGTGSNSCTYNGQDILSNIPALGYVMGDEGAGTAIGKSVLKSYFYGEMNERDKEIFHSKYDLNKPDLLAAISEQDTAAKFLAGFAAFPNLVESEELQILVKQEIEQFLIRRVVSYDEYLKYPVHFVGSIAYFYGTLIKELCIKYNLKIGTIAQKPINRLIEYHK